jgi:hypothetical protein
MSSSKLLEQAIVDAQALRDSAFKSAQATLLEKFAPQVKEAVEKLLEAEEEPGADTPAPSDALAGGDSPAPVTDFGGAPPDESNKGYVAGTAKDVPLAATDGEKLCPCPDDDESVTLDINLDDLADQLKIGKEAEEEEEEQNQQPNLAGMQNQPPAAGGAAAPIAESLELESIELEEEITEVNLDEVLAEEELEEASLEETEQLEEDVLQEYEQIKMVEMGPDGELHVYLVNDEGEREDLGLAPPGSYEGQQFEGDSDDYGGGGYGGYGGYGRSRYGRRRFEEEKKLKNPKKADLNKDGKLSSYEKKRGSAIEKSMDLKETKQLLKASQILLKEVENKDVKIKNLLEENKKFSSIIEEMSVAFKKLEEVNTLNARLFYQNQVLKSASLNERQKTHIVEAISKADSVNEAKAVYETLVNSMGGPAEKERSPKSLNEAISKKSSFRLPHKQAEQPHDSNKDRWLKLAGIK